MVVTTDSRYGLYMIDHDCTGTTKVCVFLVVYGWLREEPDPVVIMLQGLLKSIAQRNSPEASSGIERSKEKQIMYMVY